jgi:hypothetical protein
LNDCSTRRSELNLRFRPHWPIRKPSRKVLERLEKIQSLPRRKQDAILTTLDHLLNSAAS